MEEKVEHIDSKIVIKNSISCNCCPYSLYAKDGETIKYGAGNIHSNTILIFGQYRTDVDKTIKSCFNIVNDLYKKYTNRELVEDFYIARFVKCSKYSDYEMFVKGCDNCHTHLYYELKKLPASHVIYFDHKNYSISQHSYIHDVCIYLKKSCSKLPNPNIMLFNNEAAKEDFVKQFIEKMTWLNT